MRPIVHVWWANVDDLTDAHRDLLDDREQERVAALRREEDRERFVLGATVLRTLVATLDGTQPHEVALDRTCPRCGRQHGPVGTPARGFCCSVSHSGVFAIAAVVSTEAATMVGVDIETTCPPEWRELDVLAPNEQQPADEAAFVRIWTRKEAVLKATREGLSRPMSAVDLAVAPNGLTVHDLDVSTLHAVGPVAAAVAVDGPVRVDLERARI